MFSEFKTTFSTFNDILTAEIEKKFPDLPKSSLDRLKRMAEYNIPHGKLNRGLMVIEAFSEFRGGKFSKEDFVQASCLGWCIEWLQAFFLVADDVMDSSLTRRGQPCWFRQSDVGLMAVNDALILRSGLNLLLRTQFPDKTYYKLSELFNEVELATEMGQMLDMTAFNLSEGNLMDRYQLITKYKTSIYSFYLPFACAHLLANQSEQNSNSSLNEELKHEKNILLDIGYLFQVQDDILDVFGDPEKTGKIGTDIEEGKFTWLLCKCLSLPLLQENDRNLLKESRDPEILKVIYKKNEILKHFETFEAEMKVKIEFATLKLARDSSSRILSNCLNKIIKRIK